jgi:hypothetical protein
MVLMKKLETRDQFFASARAQKLARSLKHKGASTKKRHEKRFRNTMSG